LKALLAAMRRAEVVLTTSAFVVLIAVIFGDVVMRRVTGSGIVWARELGVFANIVLTIIGIGLASADGTHLRPRVFDRMVPRSWDPLMTRIQELLTALAFGVLAWIAFSVVQETIALDDRSVVLRWAVWPIQACLPLAFAAGFLRHGMFAFDPSLRPNERGEGDLA
jgi:TRAP-type C4-dicarboxylate transport system permease small subunit